MLNWRRVVCHQSCHIHRAPPLSCHRPAESQPCCCRLHHLPACIADTQACCSASPVMHPPLAWHQSMPVIVIISRCVAVPTGLDVAISVETFTTSCCATVWENVDYICNGLGTELGALQNVHAPLAVPQAGYISNMSTEAPGRTPAGQLGTTADARRRTT